MAKEEDVQRALNEARIRFEKEEAERRRREREELQRRYLEEEARRKREGK